MATVSSGYPALRVAVWERLRLLQAWQKLLNSQAREHWPKSQERFPAKKRMRLLKMENSRPVVSPSVVWPQSRASTALHLSRELQVWKEHRATVRQGCRKRRRMPRVPFALAFVQS